MVQAYSIGLFRRPPPVLLERTERTTQFGMKGEGLIVVNTGRTLEVQHDSFGLWTPLTVLQ